MLRLSRIMCNSRSGKALTTSLRKRRKLTEVRRCLTWATTLPVAASSPWRAFVHSSGCSAPAVGRLGSAPAAPLPGHILQVDRNEGHPGDPPALGWQNNGAICRRSLQASRARQRFADCSCRQQPPKQSDIAALDPAEWMVTAPVDAAWLA